MPWQLLRVSDFVIFSILSHVFFLKPVKDFCFVNFYSYHSIVSQYSIATVWFNLLELCSALQLYESAIGLEMIGIVV